MNHTEDKKCRWCETAALFVLDALSQAERDGFAAHLLEGCGACGRELEEARWTIANMDLATEHERADRNERADDKETPEASLKDRLMSRIAATQEEQTSTDSESSEEDAQAGTLVPTDLPGVSLMHDCQTDWQPADVEGVFVKMLSADEQRRYSTMLVRMDPGTSFPAHRHVGREECYVLSGDLTFGDNRMTAGDFQVAEAGSVHPMHATEEGCTLLLVACQDDERLG